MIINIRADLHYGKLTFLTKFIGPFDWWGASYLKADEGLPAYVSLWYSVFLLVAISSTALEELHFAETGSKRAMQVRRLLLKLLFGSCGLWRPLPSKIKRLLLPSSKVSQLSLKSQGYLHARHTAVGKAKVWWVAKNFQCRQRTGSALTSLKRAISVLKHY